jgi:hypothetical protein
MLEWSDCWTDIESIGISPLTDGIGNDCYLDFYSARLPKQQFIG